MIVDDHVEIIPKAGDVFEATCRKSLWYIDDDYGDDDYATAIFAGEVLIFIKNQIPLFGIFLSKCGIVSARLCDLKPVRSDI